MSKITDEKHQQINVIKIMRTCWGCPAQWEGITDDNRQIFIHFRYGYLSISMGAPGDKGQFAGVNGKEIFYWEGNDDQPGEMEYDQLKEITNDIINFPAEEMMGSIGDEYKLWE